MNDPQDSLDILHNCLLRIGSVWKTNSIQPFSLNFDACAADRLFIWDLQNLQTLQKNSVYETRYLENLLECEKLVAHLKYPRFQITRSQVTWNIPYISVLVNQLAMNQEGAT